MIPARKISLNQRNQLVQVYLHMGPEEAAELCKKYGVSENYAHKQAVEMGLIRSCHKRHWRKPVEEVDKPKRKIWTDEKTKTLRAMVADGKTYQEIADAIGHSYASVKSYVRYINLSPEERQASNRKKRQRRVYKGPVGDKPKRNIIHSTMPEKNVIPSAAIEDRNRRMMARMQLDLTGMLMGDPEPHGRPRW